LVVGGGTAGAIIAARLAEQPEAEVCLLEAGPSDESDERILDFRRWKELIGTELDYDYGIAQQARGNSSLRHPRGRVLGGSSSHNTVGALRPPEHDLCAWEAMGCTGWGPEAVAPALTRVLSTVHIEHAGKLNPCAGAFVEAAQADGYPLIEINSSELSSGVGWLPLSVRGTRRQSSSVSYLHPLGNLPGNLAVRVETPVEKLLLDDDGRTIGISAGGQKLLARREVVVSCGAFETPKLLMLSGIGPRDHLERHSITCLHDLPAVGENLMDHPEAAVVFETTEPIPYTGGHHWDAALFALDNEAGAPQVMIHHGTEAGVMDLEPVQRTGSESRNRAFCLSPNVTRPRSRGVVRLRSARPSDTPIIDPRYFTDSEEYDERTLLEGVAIARQLAHTAPLESWVRREISPGSGLDPMHVLSERVRRLSGTVFHPAGTARMGAADDGAAVVDPRLKVRGIEKLRVADASIFPTMIGVNIAITCMMIGERCAELIAHGPHR
jgi:choline dehydrogenase-like flavoprotein